MRRILVTNDDGVHSPGIHALATALERLGEVVVVAPLTEASAIGHALTLRRPLRIETVAPGRHAVDGTPTDCVNIALKVILDGVLPDMVVSGINKGYNLGDDVTYSGTVAGALEGALLGVPAIAVSLGQGGLAGANFGPAAEVAVAAAENLFARPLPSRVFLNINVPPGELKGHRATVQGLRNHETSITARVDPRGRSYYWIDELQCDWHDHAGSDYVAVREGFVSVTPLHPDMTAHAHAGWVDLLDLTTRTAAR